MVTGKAFPSLHFYKVKEMGHARRREFFKLCHQQY